MKRIYLEITNACNLDCPFCTSSKGHSFMSIEDFDNYTSQIIEVCNYIYLHVLGEPLLHPNFNVFLDILDKKDFKLQLVTNGTLLNKYPNILNHKCLRKLSISLHSVNNIETDDAYFDTINYLIENNNGTNIELRFYDKNNLDEKLNKYLNYLDSKYNLIQSKKKNSYELKKNVFVYFEELFKWPDINDEINTNNGRCHGLIDQLAILCNGDVTSCCLDTKGINTFGNLKKNTLVDILNSTQYLDALKAMKENKFILKLCKHCTYHSRFDRNNN